jgi:hypothetical protein
MTQKHELPGVDPEALNDLAKQFPSAAAKAVEDARIEPSLASKSKPEKPPAPAPQPAPQPIREKVIIKKKSGLAVFISLLALMGAAAAIAMPGIRPWVKANYGNHPVVAFIIGPKSEGEILRESIAGLRMQLDSVTKRIETDETSVASIVASVAKLDAAHEGIMSRLQSVTPMPPAGASLQGGNSDLTAWAATVFKRIEALEQVSQEAAGRQVALDTRISSVLKRLETVDAFSSNTRSFTDRLAAAEQAIGATKGAAANAAGAAQTAHVKLEKIDAIIPLIEKRLSQVEGSTATIEARIGATEGVIKHDRSTLEVARLALAILQLNNSSQTHKPFTREIDLVRRLAGGNTAVLSPLDVLTPAADTGVATMAELRDSFSAILVPKLKSLADGGDRPWSERMREWVSSAIAPNGQRQAEKDPNLRFINGATQKLAEDDLKGAIDLLSRLEGPTATIAQRWMIEAKARLAVDAASEALFNASLDLLGGRMP